MRPRQELSFVNEELKILVQSIQTGTSVNAQKIALKALTAAGEELSFTELPGERLTLVAGNEKFFVIYTNRQQVHVFSSTTFELIQRGQLIEGGCMLAENGETSQFAVVTLRGVIHVYKVATGAYSSAVTLQH